MWTLQLGCDCWTCGPTDGVGTNTRFYSPRGVAVTRETRDGTAHDDGRRDTPLHLLHMARAVGELSGGAKKVRRIVKRGRWQTSAINVYAEEGDATMYYINFWKTRQTLQNPLAHLHMWALSTRLRRRGV